MKCLPPLLAVGLLAAPVASAQIYADVETTLGTFTIEIDYVNSPLATANFIALAEGTRNWVDSTTGKVRSGQPYYDGIIFHRVIAGFVNQWGSQKGDGSDGPGYVFKDEFSTSNFNTPYKVAMANSGPQTNGSQIFVTVGTPAGLNNVHTIFGSVPADDGPDGIVDGSRGVVDAINAVDTDADDRPLTEVAILSVTIRRIGVAAQAFDEEAQELPEVSSPDLIINNPGPNTFVTVNRGVGTTLAVGLSGDLESWAFREEYIDANAFLLPFGLAVGASQSRTDRHFYTASLVHWPANSIFPDGFESKTFEVLAPFLDPTNPITFTFNLSGQGGTYNYPTGEGFNGSFNIYQNAFAPDGLGTFLILELPTLNPRFWRFNRMGMDSTSPTLISGRHTLDLFLNTGALLGSTRGTFTLTR